MTDRRPVREAEILATEAGDRVLERASELEALRKAGSSVADLRGSCPLN